MRIMINVSNNLGGGSLQVALSVVKEVSTRTDNEYFFICNSAIFNYFNAEFKDNKNFVCISKKSYFQKTKELKRIENKLKPDVVFTVFGPAYWRPKAPHLIGFANPYYLNINGPITSVFSKTELLKIKIKKLLHIFFMNRDADAIVTETESVTDGYLKLFKRVRYGFTASNTYNQFFNEFTLKEEHEGFNVLTVCKYYKHKNLEILNKVSDILERRNITDIHFILTIDDYHYNEIFKNNKLVQNKGYVEPKQCVELYKTADVMFLPTLAECFSANYPEAMKTKTCIVTSDLPFARSVCKDSACYINPFDANQIADTLCKLKVNRKLYDQYIEKGVEVLSQLPTSKERCDKYIEYCISIANLKV